MKQIVTLTTLLLLTFSVNAQKEASFWYFGQNAGLQFDADTGTVTAITNGQINTLEGCTSISDTDGNLLFYSDGIRVWNRNHLIMSNGTGLKGDPSSTSSGLIVPKPQDPDFYYLFTVDEPHHNNTSFFPNESDGDGVNDGLTYSRININDDGGLGAVDFTEKNIPLITYNTSDTLESDLKCSEKITAVRADDCSSFWVITHFVDKFYAFKVDSSGVSTTPIISETGPTVPAQGYRRNALGYLKASPDASKLLVAHYGFSSSIGQDSPGGVYLFDFNNNTGEVSNSQELYAPNNGNSPYGVEFSAESKKAYATLGGGINGVGASQLLQWDLESTDIPNSLAIISTSNSISAGALQLGLDKKIYRAQLDFSNIPNSGQFLGVINNPELTGTAAAYVQNGILLDVSGTNTNLSRIGLPPFIQSLFNSQIDIIQDGNSTSELNLCNGDDYTLIAEDIAGADYIWTLDGTVLAETSFQLLIDEPGTYEVFIEPNNGECPIEGSAIVSYFERPIANNLTNINECDPDNNNIESFDFSDKDSEILGSQNPSLFSIHYFSSLIDAEQNNTANALSFPYQNISNPQEIFVRIQNSNNPDCYATNSFMLTLFNTPTITISDDIIDCDLEDDITDGIITTNLSQLETDFLGPLQNSTDFTVSFHSTSENAINNSNPLPSLYQNAAFNDEIFVRIENNLRPECFVTDSFTITINLSPETTAVNLFQCDIDNVADGLTVFNLNEKNEDITGGNPNLEIIYYSNLTDAENETNPLNPINFNNTINPQTLIARVTDTSTGCFSFSTLTLETSTTTANDAYLAICDTDGIEDGLTVFDLSLSTTDILLGLPSDLELSFFETKEDALLEVNPLSNSYTNTTPFNQTIFVRVENSNDCYGINEVQLQVLGLPNVETEFETLYCLNTFPDTIILTGGVIDDIPNNYYYNWSTGETTKDIEINATGTYNVTITNVLGCSKQRTITVLPSNTATIENIDITDASENNTVTVLVSGEGDYQYALDTPNTNYQDSNTFYNVSPGIYTVNIRDKNGCGITSETISVIGFPKFFTPNNDGQNDHWQVKGISSQFQPGSLIYIFNRQGKLLSKVNPLSSGWDGNYNGNPLPSSDYWFTVTLQDGRKFSNHFTLKR